MKLSFENLKKTDFAILAGVVTVFVILILAYFGANKFLFKTPVLEEKEVYFSVFFRGVTITDDKSPFRVGDKTFITIRNVPYKKIEIADVQFSPRYTLIVDKNGNYQPVIDVSTPSVFDFLVTVKDKAKVTDDGAVVGGNKVKMGIPVILEGQKYKFTGVVSNVQLTDNPVPQPEPQQEPVPDPVQPVEIIGNGR